MAKHWRYEDDDFLVQFYDAVGDYIGEHDLGRAKGAATRRVAHLKKTGAWDALVKLHTEQNRSNIALLMAELDYARALGFDVGELRKPACEPCVPADLYTGSFPWRREDPYADDSVPAWDSVELGQAVAEAVSEHNDVDGVNWAAVARDIAEHLEIMLIDVAPSSRKSTGA